MYQPMFYVTVDSAVFPIVVNLCMVNFEQEIIAIQFDCQP